MQTHHDVKQVFHINPDGSGKFILSLSVDDINSHKKDRRQRKRLHDNPEKLAEIIKSYLTIFYGVDAWHEVNHRPNDSNSGFEMIATGYFADIQQLSVKLMTPGEMVKSLSPPYPRWNFSHDRLTGESSLIPHDLDHQYIPTEFDVFGLLGRTVLKKTIQRLMTVKLMSLLFQIKAEIEIHTNTNKPNQKLIFDGGKLRNKFPVPDASNGFTLRRAVFPGNEKQFMKEVENGIWSNPKLRKELFGSSEEIMIKWKQDQPPFDYKQEVKSANFKVETDKKPKWQKLDNLD